MIMPQPCPGTRIVSKYLRLAWPPGTLPGYHGVCVPMVLVVVVRLVLGDRHGGRGTPKGFGWIIAGITYSVYKTPLTSTGSALSAMLK